MEGLEGDRESQLATPLYNIVDMHFCAAYMGGPHIYGGGGWWSYS